MRSILILHRYLGVAVGLLMTLWCLSGFVMMYQSFPALESAQRLKGLEPLNLTQCCETGAYRPHKNTPVGRFSIEMLSGAPVLRMGGRDATIIRLDNGETVMPLSRAEVLGVAGRFAEGNAIAGVPRSAGTIDVDQWTVASARRNQPVWHVAFDDEGANEIYINGASGEVFQHTHRRERVLSWFGAIPHWLYPTLLRQNPPLWSEVVIWTSVLGTFLAATGLYVGVQRLRRSRNDRRLRSPYRGWWYWHHMTGLVFGVLVLTWVFSGLMTMNPWGTLSGGGNSTDYRTQLTGSADWSQLRDLLDSIERGEVNIGEALRLITPAVLNNRLYVMAQDEAGNSIRLDSSGQPAALEAATIAALVDNLDTPVQQAGLLHAEDSYYYGHKREVPLPVYRAIMDDSERTRLYIHPETGSVRSVSSTGRWSRWIRTGLHDLDFPLLRLRPVWDVVVILLLTGVTLICVTGTWMALQRVRRDWRMMVRRRERRNGVMGRT